MSARQRSYTVRPEESGQRLDSYLGARPGAGSRSQVAGLIKAGAVLVDGELRPKSYLLSAGQTVTAELPLPQGPVVLQAEDLPVRLAYQDEYLLVVDKPAGMVVHPAKGHATGTLVQALLDQGIEGGADFRPGIVHRLDKDTSGLLLVAKSVEVHRQLTELMRRREVSRRYLALVHGAFAVDSGTIDAPLGRDPVRRKTMAVGGAAAREAVTHFTVLERLGDYTLVEARLETGRTHQIRVHFLAIGHPVAGDPLYARRDPLGIGRQFLHSHKLSFPHPVSGAHLEAASPLPPELAAVLAGLR